MSQFLLKLAEIWTRQSLDDLEEFQEGFFENFVFSDFMLIFHQKNHEIYHSLNIKKLLIPLFIEPLRL